MVIYCNSMIRPFQYFLVLLAVASLSPEFRGTLGVEEEVDEPKKAHNAGKGKPQEHPANPGAGEHMEIWS